MNEELLMQGEDIAELAAEPEENTPAVADIYTEPAEAQIDEASESVEYPEDEYSLEKDMDELTREYKALVTTRKNTSPERYSELRALGLSPKEAFLATSERRTLRDTREHLGGGMPRAAKSPSTGMSRRELMLARALFDGMSDDQIRALYNKIKA